MLNIVSEGDHRYELIEKYKKKLIEGTNISDSRKEMKVLDNMLFRFWQMSWLEKLDKPEFNSARWVKDEFGSYIKHCSNCGEMPLKEIQSEEPCYSDFCPHCGHRMR